VEKLREAKNEADRQTIIKECEKAAKRDARSFLSTGTGAISLEIAGYDEKTAQEHLSGQGQDK
jgi:hypothetical protein